MFETIALFILSMQFIMTVAIYAELNHISDNIFVNGQNFKALFDRFEQRNK